MKIYPKVKEDWTDFDVKQNENELLIGNWQVMQLWEAPMMKEIAKEITVNNGKILEIGFGMGISASYIINSGCEEYTVIEAHPKIVKNALKWAEQINIPVNIIQGFWQDIIPTLENKFDGIFFDTYPLNEKERNKNHFDFIPYVPRLLNKNGLFACYSDEFIPFRQEHLTLLLNNFSTVKLIKMKNLKPPEHCEYWDKEYMIIPIASL